MEQVTSSGPPMAFIIVVMLMLLMTLVSLPVVLRLCYRRIEQGQALIVSSPSGVRVLFKAAMVLPMIQSSEVMDISIKTIEINRSGQDSLLCGDNTRVELKATFFLRVNPTSDDILKVAQSVGCTAASDPDTLERLFAPRFSHALESVSSTLDFAAMHTDRQRFTDQVIAMIGMELNGFCLEDLTITSLEPSPTNADSAPTPKPASSEASW